MLRIKHYNFDQAPSLPVPETQVCSYCRLSIALSQCFSNPVFILSRWFIPATQLEPSCPNSCCSHALESKFLLLQFKSSEANGLRNVALNYYRFSLWSFDGGRRYLCFGVCPNPSDSRLSRRKLPRGLLRLRMMNAIRRHDVARRLMQCILSELM